MVRVSSFGAHGCLTTEELAPGAAVATRNVSGMVIARVEPTDRVDATFNLTVDAFHTYFVGGQRVLVHNCETRPRNHSPEGAGRTGALRQALRDNGVPTSRQPESVAPNVDRRGNAQPGRQYNYRDGEGNSVTIRDDAAGHEFADDPSQNRGPHFNDETGRHYDYD